LTALVSFPRAEEESAVPRKMDLYWFIPALTKSSVAVENRREKGVRIYAR